MAATSTMLELGTQAPFFSLPDTDGETVSLENAEGAAALLVMFICNHGPCVKHGRAERARIGQEYAPRGVAIVAINSNDADAYPADGPDAMRHEKEQAGYPFPYLYDRTQDVAKAYHAACTPDFFLFDADHRLVYRGQLDDSRPGNGLPATGRDLRRALEALLEGRPVPPDQKPSIGCSIKWRPGNAPAYPA
jgi:peroxiredoxin